MSAAIIYAVGYVLSIVGFACAVRRGRWNAAMACLVLMIILALAAGGSVGGDLG